MKARLAITTILFLSLSIVSAWADPYEELKKRFSSEEHLLGIGEVKSSGDPRKDRRRAEILARLEIATGIKVRVKESTFDIMCEGKGKALYDNSSECRNQVVMVVESSVDEVLEGTKIIEVGEDKDRGLFYAVAVLPKKHAAAKADDASKDAMEQAKEHLDKAKAAKDENVKKEETRKAKEEIKKSMAYEEEKAAIEGIKGRSRGMLDELVGEIGALDKGIGGNQ